MSAGVAHRYLLSVGAYTIWPWPYIYPISHTSVSPCPVCHPVRASEYVNVYCQHKPPNSPGMLMEFRLFFQVTVVCALRGVSVNSYKASGDKHTCTASHKPQSLTYVYCTSHKEEWAQSSFSERHSGCPVITAFVQLLSQQSSEQWTWSRFSERMVLLDPMAKQCMSHTKNDQTFLRQVILVFV